jgi:arginine decarboxylase
MNAEQTPSNDRPPSSGTVRRAIRRPRPHQYDAAQLRRDTWNDLQFHTHWLREALRLGNGIDEPKEAVAGELETLRTLESFWAFPGSRMMNELTMLFEQGKYDLLSAKVKEITRLLVSDAYRTIGPRGEEPASERHHHQHLHRDRQERVESLMDRNDDIRPYFEVLFVDDIDEHEHEELRAALLDLRRDEDEFIYDVVFARSFQDAAVAMLFNHTIQSCVFRYNIPFQSVNEHPIFSHYLEMMWAEKPARVYGLDRSLELGRIARKLRPELDLFLVTDAAIEDVAGRLGRNFKRVFYRLDNYLELHLSILKGIRSRYETPFFDALRKYAQRPTGVFHALPIARGKSITNSHWVKDMGRFYGPNIFLAETSATSGGLDSLLQPHGAIKRAQDLAARAFGARRTFFATNGTSTANKIVVQALVQPGDIVLVAHDCHKSHHYAMMLAGAQPIYLDAYPLTEYSIYGAVPLREIKRHLIELKRAGKLDRVRMLLLTNCTFDGITYHPERIMREVLAIKPDMIFLWDEAWFAFAAFNPTLRLRTGMYAADKLRNEFKSDDYRFRYREWRESFDKLDPDDDATWLDQTLMPDPDASRVRVYATQSTHKTLTSLRQGSMIHVYDQDFDQLASEPFNEAFMTHTSTSPNYQIIASLDVGRRQVELEGYEMVQKSISLAMSLRERIYEHPTIKNYFSVLRPADLIPEEYRPSGLEYYYDPDRGWKRMDHCWRNDEFALDPTRVTVHIGRTGIDGDTLRHLLMDQHDIQINKTSRNTVLFLTNIGMSRGDVAYLVEVLERIGRDIDDRIGVSSSIDMRLHRKRIASLTEELPPLPNFSRFHPCFKPDPDSPTPEGDIRKAFFMTYDGSLLEHFKLGPEIDAVLATGRELVSAAFVTPYPPGFPVLVPGQVISRDILDYLIAVDVKEIHGYKPEYGLRVFTDEALERAAAMKVDQPIAELAESSGDI